MSPVSPFTFNGPVASVFDDMADRSIPFYDVVQGLTAELVSRFVKPGSLVYDLGCSTGNTMVRLLETFLQYAIDDIQLVGIDASEDMCAKAQEKVSTFCERRRGVTVLCAELRRVELKPATAIVMNYTLHFLRPQDRAALLSHIYQALLPGGILIVSDKTLQSSTTAGRAFAEIYYDFKRSHGYSELEISQKREALENVLVPYRAEEEVDLLRSVGFESVDPFFTWCNFTSFLCIKRGLPR